MTTIDQIKAECQRAIELGEKATPGPWEQSYGNRPYVLKRDESGGYLLADFNSFTADVEQCSSDAAFVAHSRMLSPAAARALLIAIAALETCQVWDDKNSRMIYPAGCAMGLEKIIDAWECVK